jgi:hypothetical protein
MDLELQAVNSSGAPSWFLKGTELVPEWLVLALPVRALSSSAPFLHHRRGIAVLFDV